MRKMFLLATILVGGSALQVQAQDYIPQRHGKSPLADANMPGTGSASETNHNRLRPQSSKSHRKPRKTSKANP